MQMRPVFNNFGSGAITPKLFGQPDSPLYRTGLETMKNMVPELFGSAKRRGGLKHMADLPVGVISRVRLIPWSVSYEIDLILVFSDGEIRIVDASFGHTFGFVEYDGSDLVISELDAEKTIDAYSENDIDKINYSVGIGCIYLAHNKYPLTMIRMESYDSGGFRFNVVKIPLSGVIASTPLATATAAAASDILLASDLLSATSGLISGKTYNFANNGLTGTINGYAVTSVTRNFVAGNPRYATVRVYYSVPGGTKIYDSSSLPNGIDSDSPGNKEIRLKRGGVLGGLVLSESNTNTQLFDYWESVYILDDVEYDIKYRPENGWWNDILPSGWLIYHHATPSKVSVTITLTGASDLVVDKDSGAMTGYIRMTNPNVSINKYTPGSPGATAALENIMPWIDSDTRYDCAGTESFMDVVPKYVIKRDAENTYDDTTGEAVKSEDAHLEIHYDSDSDGDVFVRLTQNTVVTGVLSVIVNPFIGVGKYPAFVAFHNGRMVLGGSVSEPNTVYLSKTNDFTNFSYFEEIEYDHSVVKPKDEWDPPDIPAFTTEIGLVQQVGQDSAMKLQLLTDESESLRWAASIGDLIIGTATSEWVIPKEVNAHNALAIMTSRNGSCSVQGRFVKGSILFASANANSLRMFQGKQGEVTEAISDHAEHLFRANGSIQSFDFRQDPYFGIVTQMSSGKAILGVINSDSIGWCELSTRTGDSIESICVIAKADEDAVYASVLRGSSRYIERMMTTDDDTSSILDRVYLDSWVTGTTSVSGEISGLSRFGGAADVVVMFEDGESGAPVIAAGTSSTYIDSDGVTQANPVSKIYVAGYKYESEMKTLRIDTSQIEGLQKHPASFHLRVYRSGDLWIKRKRALDTELVQVHVPADEGGVRDYPYSGKLRVENPNGTGENQSLALYTNSHEPLTVQMIVPTFGVGEEP
jgi:hypothetical protein